LAASRLATIRMRRAALRQAFDIRGDFDAIKESCVPSYCHDNIAAAAVSWWRLLCACRLARGWVRPGPVLDFGAGTGELHHLLAPRGGYHFVEANERCAGVLLRAIPGARRETLESLASDHFAAVFALDSLEHNHDFAFIAEKLLAAVRPGGHLILSGPTENSLYRLGRRLAGFSGHYHVSTIYDIERIVSGLADRRAVRQVPPLLPLFRISVWERR